MSVVNKLEKIAKESFSNFTWVFDDWKSADRALTRVDVPAIVCIMPTGGTLTFRRGRVWDAPNCYLAFLDKVTRDANGTENEEVFEWMKGAAIRFVSEMNKSGLFEPIDGNINYDTIVEGTSNILTGVGLSLTIQETEAVCL